MSGLPNYGKKATWICHGENLQMWNHNTESETLLTYLEIKDF